MRYAPTNVAGGAYLVQPFTGIVKTATGEQRSVYMAYSSDGGATFTNLRFEASPTDAGAIASLANLDLISMPASPTERHLVFTNVWAPGGSSTQGLTARVSCDGGETWSGKRTLNASATGASSVTPLGTGMGVVYEADGPNDARFASFDID
ncbi:exo-alpha-sialidase [Micrococcales bacterium 31B]|nr:exo-alpha-sialidase [Micrococcales bacterium 31B]